MLPIALRAVLATALASLACASGRGQPEQGAPAPDQAVVLSISNNTWSDVEVYVLSSSVRSRVANVESMNSARVPIARDLWALGWVQVQVHPVGGGTPFVTDRIDVHGGQRITLTVEKQRSLSTWVVERMSNSW